MRIKINISNRLHGIPFFSRFMVLAITCLLAPGGELIAQSTSVLRVVATAAEDGSPLPGTNVVMYNPEDDPEFRDILYYCVTNTDGLCEIRDIRANREYALRATFVGYKPYQDTLSFDGGEVKIVRAVLAQSVAQIGKVTVEQERYITTGEAGINRIHNIDITRIPTPAGGGDLASYLQAEPGVISTGDRGGNLFIRGGTPEQNLILVDNLPIFKPFHISNLFSTFPGEIIHTADLYAGGFGAKYARATSAVIDLNLRPGNFKEKKFKAGVSPYLVSLHLEGPIEKNRNSYLFMARKSTIRPVGPVLTGSEIPVNFYDIVGRYSVQEDNGSCNVTGIRTYDSGEIVPDRAFHHSWSNTILGARCIGFDEEFNYPVEATAGFSHYKNTEGTPGETERLSTLRNIYMNFDLKQKLIGLLFNYGVGLNFKSYRTVLTERFTNLESFEHNVPEVHLYTSTEWSPVNTISIHPGIASQLAFNTLPTFEPRLRISFRPDGTNRQEISLAAGKYTQLFAGISDERDVGTIFTVLEPLQENAPLYTSLHGILGYHRRIGDHFRFRVEGYVKSHEHIPVSKWNPEVGIELETTFANGWVRGFDVSFEFEKESLFTSVSYGWSKVKYEADSGNLGAWIKEPVFGYAPPHDQRHKFNGLISYKIAGFTTNARWEFGSGKPYTRIFGFDMSVRVPIEDPNIDPGTARTLFNRPYGARLPYYHRLDISLGKSFDVGDNWDMNLQAGVINAYDRNNIFSFDFHSLQRVDQTPLLPFISIEMKRK